MAKIKKFLRQMNKEKRRGYYFFPVIPEERTVLMLSIMQHEIPRIIVADVLESGRKKTDLAIADEVSRIGCRKILPKEIRYYFIHFLIPAKIAICEVRYKSASSGEFLFSLTPEGEKFAKIAARFTVAFVARRKIHLGDIFGKDKELINGSARRAFREMKMLYEARECKRRVELQLEAFVNEVTLVKDLERLERLKLVKINKSSVKETGTDGWRWTGSRVLGRFEDAATARIARLIKKNRRLKNEDIANLSREKRKQISRALHSLSTMKKIVPFGIHPVSRKIETILTPEGRNFFEEFPAKVFKFSSGGNLPVPSDYEKKSSRWIRENLELADGKNSS